MENYEARVCNLKSNDRFIDRSKVRILLCDNDDKSSREVFELLSKCSYQVTSVRSARQVIDTINAEGPKIDIILSEIDLPTRKGLKMLKYMMRDRMMQRIPVIMMSAQDEVSLVVKCLRFGAVDYLVKPLRTNELLNLWTHMWRRREMLGLVEKNVVNYDFDLAASDPSEANTNSTTFLSDDTEERSHNRVNPELSITIQQEDESNKVVSKRVLGDSLDYQPDVPGICDRRTGQFLPFPKSGIKIGECSAFFAYVRSNAIEKNCQTVANVNGNVTQTSKQEDKSGRLNEHASDGNMRYEKGYAWENDRHEDFPSSTNMPDSNSMDRSSTPVSLEYMSNKSNDEGLSHAHLTAINGTPFGVSGLTAHIAQPYYMSGPMNRFMMSSSAHMYQKGVEDHNKSAMMAHHNHLPYCPPHVPGMAQFTYYPSSTCVQGQLPSDYKMPSYANSCNGDAKMSEVCRRQAALIKFRRKRKERCFDKKIRYVNRKKLAERRPRVRGQFVRKMNGVMVDLNGDPSPSDLDEEDEDDDPTSRDSSPKEDVS